MAQPLIFMVFKDYFSQTAADYAHYRPHYPKPLFAYLSEIAPDRTTAWDCATGNGQVAYELADYFEQVYGSDASEQQISHARHRDRLQYFVAIAQSTPLADQSIALITVAQAFHWFNANAFYNEVRRVLKPNGVIALWCYGFFTIAEASDGLNQSLHAFFETIDAYWSPERLLITNRYQTIDFPFLELSAPSFAMNQDWTVEQLIGYLTTWSAVQSYSAQQGSEQLSVLLKAIADHYPATSLTVNFPLSFRIGRYVI